MHHRVSSSHIASHIKESFIMLDNVYHNVGVCTCKVSEYIIACKMNLSKRHELLGPFRLNK